MVKIQLWLWPDLPLEIWQNPTPDRFGNRKSDTAIILTEDD